MPTLTDTRTNTMKDAERLMEQIALTTQNIEKKKAQYELRISKLKAKYEEEAAPDIATLQSLERTLDAFIMSHQKEFRRPRKRKTAFGDFGLRTVSDVQIDDRDLVADFCMEAGYTDCVETRITLKKSAIRKRLVERSLIEAARRDAAGEAA